MASVVLGVVCRGWKPGLVRVALVGGCAVRGVATCGCLCDGSVAVAPFLYVPGNHVYEITWDMRIGCGRRHLELRSACERGEIVCRCSG